MINAVEETLRDDFAHELDVEPGLTEPRMVPRWSTREPEHVSV